MVADIAPAYSDRSPNAKIREAIMERLTFARPLLLVLLTAFLSGCQVIGDIFKTGVWTGVILVLVVIGLVIFGIVKMLK